jgi:C1A family cysteine protease
MAKKLKKLKKLKKYGWIPDTPDHRDLKYSPPRQIAEALPPVVDLRGKMPGVYDQGELGSCTANAIGGDLEYAQIRQGQQHWTPSRLFIYYNERVIENSVREDSGAMLRDGIKAVVRWGFCPETDWPYVISQFTRKPPRMSYKNAVKNRIQQYARVSQRLDDMRACLAGGDPFFYGFSVYDSFESNYVAETGLMPMPRRGERLLGGHAVLAVGYDDNRKVIIVRNSWGTGWGDKGYFYMPYDFIVNPDYADDFWTVTYVP